MRLDQLGDKLGVSVHGDGRHTVSRLAPIESAGPDDLAFVVGKRYTEALKASLAGAVILPQTMLDDAPGNALVSDNPYACYAQASWLLSPQSTHQPGIHATAVVHPDAQIAPSACIGEFVVIGSGSIIEEDAVISAHCHVGCESRIGMGTLLFPRVTVYDNVVLGAHCRVQSGAVIGSEGFGYAWTGKHWRQIQQTGGVRIGQYVHVGANTTIDCGAIEATIIEEGVILDNQIQIAHNVQIGKHTAIAGCVGIAGSTTIGAHCQIGGACNIVGHISICDQVIINAASLVTRSIDEKGRYGSGMPLQQEQVWRRTFVNLGRLDRLFKRVARLEQK